MARTFIEKSLGQSLLGEKVRAGEEERGENNGVNRGHYVLHQRVQRQPLRHALHSDQNKSFNLHLFSLKRVQGAASHVLAVTRPSIAKLTTRDTCIVFTRQLAAGSKLDEQLKKSQMQDRFYSLESTALQWPQAGKPDCTRNTKVIKFERHHFCGKVNSSAM